jgi:uncharacterized protein involved in exopolysaccharide biosynthesis
MLIVFVSIVAGDISWIALSPRAYESVVKIFVKRARMETLGGERDTSTTGPVDVSESDIRSEIEILRSRDLLEGVVAQCGMAPVSHNPSPADRLLAAVQVHSLEENLKIVPVSKTNIIAVRYRSRNARQASSILHALTGLYMGKHTALHRLHETSEFFGDQETRYRSDLAKAQQNLSAFQQRYEASLLEERKGLNVKRMAELDAVEQQISAEVQDATDRARVLTTERDVLPNMIQSQSRTARNQALLDRLKAHMLELQNKRTELLTRFEPGYPLIKEVDQQTKDTQDAIAHEENPVVVEQIESLNPLRESITAELSRTNSSIAGLLARRRSVINDLASSRQKQRSMEQLTVEHEDLQRNKNVTEANYLLYEKKTEEARIADALDQRKFLNVSILEEPETPVLPVDKHSVVILLLGSILAITCAFGSASAAESLDPLVRSPFELTLRTGMPVLATLSGARILSSVASEMALPAPKEGEQRLRDSFDFEATDPSPS